MGLGVTWLDVALALACMTVGAGWLWLLAGRRGPLPAAASHAAMGLGMAAMFVPAADPVPAPLWVAVFVVSGSWFGAEVLRAGTLLGTAGGHVAGAAAMLFMLLGGHDHAAAAGGPVDPGHAHHAAAGGGSGGLLVTLAALVLAAWFVADLVRIATHRTVPEPAAPVAEGAVAVAVTARATGVELPVVGHVVMNAAMLVMLLGMV
ncbi:DUF5134 domain-containing protein [Pseudonocardia sp.]|uniref:DUF5134 domain-containing protein n=1 Tax=Pseudonocardia sp. TaxID=60912 RepID=UPI00260E466F|nr:DUF5134 domain-containing protein [Pseudonocardia sp.]